MVLHCRRSRGDLGIVSDDTDLRVRLIQSAAVPGRHGPDPVILLLDWDQVVAGSGLDDDFVSLPDPHQDGVGVVGFNGDKVVGDDLEDMFVDGEDKGGRSRGIDEADEVLPSLLENLGEDRRRLLTGGRGVAGLGAVEVAAAVQDVRLHGGRSDELLDVVVLEGAVVAPVAEHKGLDGLVVVGRGRAVEGHRARQSIRILEGVMAVVPRRPVLGHSESVRMAVSRRNGALRDTVDAIVLELVQQTGPVPVYGGAIVVELVVDGNLEYVSPAGFDPRTGILAVKGLATVSTHETIRIDGMLVDGKIVLPRHSKLQSFMPIR